MVSKISCILNLSGSLHLFYSKTWLVTHTVVQPLGDHFLSSLSVLLGLEEDSGVVFLDVIAGLALASPALPPYFASLAAPHSSQRCHGSWWLQCLETMVLSVVHCLFVFWLFSLMILSPASLWISPLWHAVTFVIRKNTCFLVSIIGTPLWPLLPVFPA